MKLAVIRGPCLLPHKVRKFFKNYVRNPKHVLLQMTVLTVRYIFETSTPDPKS